MLPPAIFMRGSPGNGPLQWREWDYTGSNPCKGWPTSTTKILFLGDLVPEHEVSECLQGFSEDPACLFIFVFRVPLLRVRHLQKPRLMESLSGAVGKFNNHTPE